MNEPLTLIGSISTVYWLISFIDSEFLPNFKEVIYSIQYGTVKAWRILHLILVLMWYYEPSYWLKVLTMMLAVECSVKIAKPIVDWIFAKLGIQ
jgi:hypothetical protein